MSIRRRYVLGGMLAALAFLAAVLLAKVLGTVFFAITVAYLLAPVRTQLTERGLPPWYASALLTVSVFLVVVLLAAPLIVIAALRLDALLALVATFPDSITIDVLGYPVTITLEQAIALATNLLRSGGRQALSVAPILLGKLALFAFLVFALVHHYQDARRAILAVVPPSYRGVVEALNHRTQSTLFAIYVLQAATAAGTFIIALPVFFILGHSYPITLATICAILQFIPVVGPSLVLIALAAYHLSVGQVEIAVAVLVVGGFFIAWLPDILIRPRLARETARLPGSLYFIGFTGGLLTIGPIGVIAGPLAVALVAEMASILSAELNRIPVTEE